MVFLVSDRFEAIDVYVNVNCDRRRGGSSSGPPVIRIHYKSGIDHNTQWVRGSMHYKLLLCFCAAFFSLSSIAAPKDDISDLAEFSNQLDAQDRQQLSTLLSRADNCTLRRDFDCSERLLAQARKYAQGRADAAKLEAARNRLARERDAEAREIQAQRDEEERIAKAERRKEKQREKWEQQQRDAEAAQSHSAMYQSIGATIAAAGRDVGNYVNSSGQALYNAQWAAQKQQMENDRRRRSVDDDGESDHNEARDTRKRSVDSSRSNTASSSTDSSSNRDQAAESKRRRDEALLAQKKQDQELAAVQQSSTAKSNAAASQTLSTTSSQNTPPARDKECSLPDGRNAPGNTTGWSDCNYEYKVLTVEGKWLTCEYSREGALAWAQRSLESSGMESCQGLGGGWRARSTNKDMFQFSGYVQTPACDGGKSWKAEITSAMVVCMHRK